LKGTTNPNDKKTHRNELQMNEACPTTPPCNRRLEEKLRLEIFFASRNQKQLKQTKQRKQPMERKSNDNPPTEMKLNLNDSPLKNKTERNDNPPTEMNMNPNDPPMKNKTTRNKNPPTKMKLNQTEHPMRPTTTRNDKPQKQSKPTLNENPPTEMELNILPHKRPTTTRNDKPRNKNPHTDMKVTHTTTIPKMKVSHMSMKWQHQAPDRFKWTLRQLDAYLEIVLEPG
jgi:hypothetical protein